MILLRQLTARAKRLRLVRARLEPQRILTVFARLPGSRLLTAFSSLNRRQKRKKRRLGVCPCLRNFLLRRRTASSRSNRLAQAQIAPCRLRTSSQNGMTIRQRQRRRRGLRMKLPKAVVRSRKLDSHNFCRTVGLLKSLLELRAWSQLPLLKALGVPLGLIMFVWHQEEERSFSSTCCWPHTGSSCGKGFDLQG